MAGRQLSFLVDSLWDFLWEPRSNFPRFIPSVHIFSFFQVFTLIYVAVGLALTTIAIEIAADTLKKLHYFGRKIENVGNVQIWFGGQK